MATRVPTFRILGCRCAGEWPPMPRRRTFARGILPLTHSDADFASASCLRSSSHAGSRGMGGHSPPVEVCRGAKPGGPCEHQPAEAGPGKVGRQRTAAGLRRMDATRSTSRRRPAQARSAANAPPPDCVAWMRRAAPAGGGRPRQGRQDAEPCRKLELDAQPFGLEPQRLLEGGEGVLLPAPDRPDEGRVDEFLG